MTIYTKIYESVPYRSKKKNTESCARKKTHIRNVLV